MRTAVHIIITAVLALTFIPSCTTTTTYHPDGTVTVVRSVDAMAFSKGSETLGGIVSDVTRGNK